MLKYLKVLAVAVAVMAASIPAIASAHGHGHGGSRVFIGVGGYWGPSYPYSYYPPAYYPAPAYYYPPPAYVTPAPPYQSSYCRQFNGDATIDASGGPFYGTACLGADGKWHIGR